MELIQKISTLRTPMLYPRPTPRTEIKAVARSGGSAILALGALAVVLATSGVAVEARSNFHAAELRSPLPGVCSPPRRARSKEPSTGQCSRGGMKRRAVSQGEPTPPPKQASGRSMPEGRAIRRPPKWPSEPSPQSERSVVSPSKKGAVEPHSQRPGGQSQYEKPQDLLSSDNSSDREAEAILNSTARSDKPQLSACQSRLTPDLAAIQVLPDISAGECVAAEVVRLDAIIAKSGLRVAVTPPATLRCPMAESVIHWIRDDVASVAFDLGAALKSMTVDTSFECRSRNQVAGAKLSEHGHANAIDLRAFTLDNGVVVGLTDKNAKREAREHLQQTACARFTTVLGPGSDGYHENHVHLDLAERRGGYRICQWDVHDPPVLAGVPVPPDRPPSAPPRDASTAKSGGRE
jgi:hypothetical protein